MSPEIEIGIFLTEVAKFANTPAMLGSVELFEGGKRHGIAVVHAQVGNQGDAWTVTAGYLDRLLERERLLAAGSGNENRQGEERTAHMHHLMQIGRRTAELHLALASGNELADFAPEPIQPPDVARWASAIVESAERVFNTLRQRRGSLTEADRAVVDDLLAQQDSLPDRLNALMPPRAKGLNLRLHGDFHLGRVLIVKDDVSLTGFEGDLRRPIEERRRKAPAARDVAGMIWSIEAASHAARERALRFAPDEPGRLGVALTAWIDRATNAFLSGYRELIADSPIWPEEPLAARRMVDFFLLEKAFDALETELVQRAEAAPSMLGRALRILSSLPVRLHD
jgi:maltose alpha-D-glucosyltransferase/alpha-amylase